MPYPLDEDGEVVETSTRSFVGLANFSSRYVNNFALLAYQRLVEKDEQRDWTLAHIIAFDAAKYDAAWSKGLVHIDYRLPIYICTDACKEGIGGVLVSEACRFERRASRAVLLEVVQQRRAQVGHA